MKTGTPDTPGPRALTHLGEMPIETFLKDYWQKQPLLIRNAFTEAPLVPADELAGYSLEEEIESRILIETPGEHPLHSEWQLHHGPFAETFYSQLPESHWTLLVQAVDQLHPQIHELLHQFRFIPNWRVDDIMVSYAADGGNVGPHFDYYDVFLLQAQGRRRWRLGQTCSASSPLRSDTDCKILVDFDANEEWLLNPGDMLYIPPNIAHWGTAEGECITYSVGFRAPSHSDILLDLCQDIAATTSDDQRFQDPGRSLASNPGLITFKDVTQVRRIVEQLLSDDQVIQDWFGRYMTQSRRHSLQFDSESAICPTLLTAQARAAYTVLGENEAVLYINGEQFACSLSLAERLCSYTPIDLPSLSESDQALVQTIIDYEWMQS